MISEEKEVKDLMARFAFWILQIRTANGAYLYDSNKIAEAFSLKLLNLLYNLQLEDLNDKTANAPALDLIDKKNGIAFQVSSRTDNNKVISTLRKLAAPEFQKFAEEYPKGIRFFVLSEAKFDFKRIKPVDIFSGFDEKRDLIYPEDVGKQIKRIYETDIVRFGLLKELFHNEISYPEPLRPAAPSPESAEFLKLLQQSLGQATQNPAPTYTVQGLYEADLSLPVSTFASQRQETVKSLTASLNQYSVVWMWGSVDTGKSSLAILTGRQFEPNTFWLDFQSSEIDTLFSKLVSLMASCLDVPLTKNRRNDLTSLIAKIPGGSLVVVNDLPDLAGANKTKQEFSYFCQLLSQSGLKILITSNQPPFGELESALTGKQFLAVEVPPFVADEVVEVLHFYNAPNAFIKEHVELLTSVTDGHAFLVHNAALYLKNQEWSTADDVIIRLFKNEYGQSYTSEVYAKILNSTQDEHTQTLLYRTAVIMGSFTDAEIETVGMVDPVIERTHQRSQALKGAWLQEVEKGHFKLSLLVKRLGNNLPDDLQRKINEALGDKLTNKPLISQIDANSAILYYLQGKAYVKLSWVLMRVLEFSLTNPAVFFDWGFQLFWYRSVLPQEIPPIFKALIRGLQIQLTVGQKEDPTFLLNDLEQILDKEEVGLLGCTYAQLTISQVSSKSNPAKSFRYFLQVRKNWAALQRMFPEKEDNRILSDDFFWTTFYALRKKEDFEEWFGLLATADNKPDKAYVEKSEPYVLAAHSLVNLINIPAGNSSEPVIETLQTVLQLAIREELPLIAVYALRYLVVVYGSYTKQFQEIENLIQEYEELIFSEPIYTFLVYEEYGRQLFYDGEIEEAKNKLSPVIDTMIGKPYLDGIEGLRVYSELITDTNAALANIYMERAIARVRADKFFPETDAIKLMGEAAISLWLLKNRVEAMHLLEEAYARLLNIFQETEDHQATLIRLSHVSNYIGGEIKEGRPPKKADGSIYITPKRGIFYKNAGALLASNDYFEERKFIGGNVFEDVFEYLGDYERACKWAFLNIEIALSLKKSKYFPILLQTLPYLILERQYLKAVNLYVFVEDKLEEIRQVDREGKDIGEYSQVRNLLGDERKAGFDEFAFRVIIFLTTITLANDILRRRISRDVYPEVIESIMSAWSNIIREPKELSLLWQIFREVLINGISSAGLDAMLDTYDGANKASITTVAYILQSIFADAKEALNLQMSIARQFDSYQQWSPAAYRFEIAPFLQNFWVDKFKKYPGQVRSEAFWYSKSLPYLENSPLQDKVRHTFKVVKNHIEMKITPELEDWIMN